MRDCGLIPHGDPTFKRYSAEIFVHLFQFFVSLLCSIDVKSSVYNQPNFLAMLRFSRISLTSLRK